MSYSTASNNGGHEKQRCVDKEEEYIERDKSKILRINQIIAPVSFLNCQTLYKTYFVPILSYLAETWVFNKEGSKQRWEFREI